MIVLEVMSTAYLMVAAVVWFFFAAVDYPGWSWRSIMRKEPGELAAIAFMAFCWFPWSLWIVYERLVIRRD